jgi:hypothetical protein
MVQQNIGKRATRVYYENGYIVVRYHSTDVVRFNDKEIILNSGGWRTATTKTSVDILERMKELVEAARNLCIVVDSAYEAKMQYQKERGFPADPLDMVLSVYFDVSYGELKRVLEGISNHVRG